MQEIDKIIEEIENKCSNLPDLLCRSQRLSINQIEIIKKKLQEFQQEIENKKIKEFNKKINSLSKYNFGSTLDIVWYIKEDDLLQTLSK
jgi:hypothetical protein